MTIQTPIRPYRMLLALLGLLLSGCAAPLYTGPIFQGQRIPATAPVAAPTPTPDRAGNRLLYLGADGNLYTSAPDGGQALALTSDAGPRRAYSQPTWSPDGSRLAWTRIDNGRRGFVVVSRPDGSVEVEAEVAVPPFYYAWSRGGERLAYLSNWSAQQNPTLGLHLLDLTAAEPTVKTIATGQPLYFSWAPTGDFLLTHIGNRVVGIYSLDGRSTVLSERSGNFAAPQWLADPTLLAYAVRDGAEQQVVVGNLRSGQVRELTYFNGALGFSISPDGRKLAYTDSEGGERMNSFGPLLVLDLPSGEFRQLSSGPVVAFFWSPDSSSLYYLTALVRSGEFGLGLAVWNGERTVDLGIYQPDTAFLNQYLRFADQYGQSASYWSPDSRAVLFSGRNREGVQGVWVIPADGSAPRRVADGVYGVWSWK